MSSGSSSYSNASSSSSKNSNASSSKNSNPIEIKENAHTKIMREMAKYLDDCKNSKQNCQCTGVLEYNPNEPNEFKKWVFAYQCNNVNSSNNLVKKITMDLLRSDGNIKEEVYNVKS